MNNLFRGLLAGWGASKLGGGCLGTILVFALIWWALGTCDGNQRAFIPKKTPQPIAVCDRGIGR
jgi:hypothetical protein